MKKFKGILIIAIIVGVLCMFAGCGNSSIDLNKYIVTQTSGNNGSGTISVRFDTDKFVKDYDGKIKYTKDGEEAMSAIYGGLNGLFKVTEAQVFAIGCENGFKVDKTSNLSNGDKVTITWTIDDESMSEIFTCKASHNEMVVEISGLK